MSSSVQQNSSSSSLSIPPLSVPVLPSPIILDIRPSCFFNGWPESNDSDSIRYNGHIPNSINFSFEWMSLLSSDAVLILELHRKGVQLKSHITLYGGLICSEEQIQTMEQCLFAIGFTSIARLSFAESIALYPTRIALPHFHQLVPASWLHHLIFGNKSTLLYAPTDDFQIFEADFGPVKDSRYNSIQGHIPTAQYVDTNCFEGLPLWNVYSDDILYKFVTEQLRITPSTTIILYSKNTLAAARLAHVLMYLGARDVRLLDGGWDAWKSIGGFTERGINKGRIREELDNDGSIAVKEGWIRRSDYMISSIEEARATIESKDAVLASVRSWKEHIGETSGYSYIQAKGDIEGCKWAHGGLDSNSMQDYRNLDGTMRSMEEITAMWMRNGINPDSQRIGFYCGTGWRASEAFFYAYIAGYKSVAVYDGGWFEWSSSFQKRDASDA